MILASPYDQRLSINRYNKKVATTNGVFDLLHVGHVRFLQSIKKIADVLIVCVNSDESVGRIRKDPMRPIIPLSERMEILDALSCVDYVVSFEEDTPCEILSKIKPDVHVKDWDYGMDVVPEKEVVVANGGQMVFLPRVEGYSTTNIIARIIGTYKMNVKTIEDYLPKQGTAVIHGDSIIDKVNNAI